QNAVAAQGYPAPRVLCASADPIPLGGAFLVMERLPGERLLDARRLGIASVLVDMQMRLHALDPDVLWRALDADAPAIARDVMTFGGYLRRLAARVDDGALDGLRPAMRWLLDHRPPEPAPLSICHGDFHPHNLLYARGAVTGVL